MFKRRKNEPREGFPSWLKWGVVAFVVLAMGLNALGIHPPGLAVKGPAGSVNPEAVNQVSPWESANVESYKSLIFPGAHRLEYKEERTGEGISAICGQDVEVKLTQKILLPDRSLPTPGFSERPEDGRETLSGESITETKTFSLSDTTIDPQLKHLVTGMRPGGMRHAVIPPRQTANGKYAADITVELLTVSPALTDVPADTLPLKIFDEQTRVSPSVTCGTEMQAHFTVWDAQGKSLFSTHANNAPKRFILGTTPMMEGLLRGMQGIGQESSRTLLIPPYLQAMFTPTADQPSDSAEQIEPFLPLTLSGNELIVVEITPVP